MMKSEPTINFAIYIAGDYNQARQICSKYCFEIGLCVSLSHVDYIYTGGEESGIKVLLINYPRFPSDAESIKSKAHDLAIKLMEGLNQHSYSLVGPDKTDWVSRRLNE